MTPIEQCQQRVTEAREHTPGPWKLEFQGTMHGNVAMYFVNPSTSIGTSNPADANLIEAAPELLEVAKYCEEILLSYGINRIDGEEIADKALKLIQAAIAKATGAKP